MARHTVETDRDRDRQAETERETQHASSLIQMHVSACVGMRERAYTRPRMS